MSWKQWQSHKTTSETGLIFLHYGGMKKLISVRTPLALPVRCADPQLTTSLHVQSHV